MAYLIGWFGSTPWLRKPPYPTCQILTGQGFTSARNGIILDIAIIKRDSKLTYMFEVSWVMGVPSNHPSHGLPFCYWKKCWLGGPPFWYSLKHFCRNDRIYGGVYLCQNLCRSICQATGRSMRVRKHVKIFEKCLVRVRLHARLHVRV